MPDPRRVENGVKGYARFDGDVIRSPKGWLVHFIVDGFPLPTSITTKPEWLSIEKLDEWKARISIQVTLSSANENPVPMAEERLLNFLSTYNVVSGMQARIDRLDGGNEIVVEGAKELVPKRFEGQRRYLGAISAEVAYRVLPAVDEQSRLDNLQQTTRLFELNERIIREQHSFLHLAIMYYNLGKSSKEFQEAVLDWVIALEALFSDSEGELQHKLSLRVAWMLGRDGKDRTGIAKRVRSLYGIRSDIVHGRLVKITGDDVRTLENYVRKCIIKILERDDKPQKDTILRELDDRLLGQY